MRVAIHQPHYLPSLRYMDTVARADVFVVLDSVQFTRHSWQNRTRIKTNQGTRLLTIPVVSQLGQPMALVTVPPASPWRRKHAHTIAQAYREARYFERYWEQLAAIYERRWNSPLEVNRYLLPLLCEWLGIRTTLAYASEFAVDGFGTRRLINLVRMVGGDTYFTTAAPGAPYLDAHAFSDAGITLERQVWACPEYPQLHGGFVPDLSVLDLLMNCGGRAYRILVERR